MFITEQNLAAISQNPQGKGRDGLWRRVLFICDIKVFVLNFKKDDPVSEILHFVIFFNQVFFMTKIS